MDQRTPRRREKRLNQIRTVTKRRIINMFDENDVAYLAQQGPTWSWRSGVRRFAPSCMTGNIQSELAQMEHIGPGVYKMPEPHVINLHLSKQPRFQLDATTADVRTELQLPGTEHIGPGYYPKPDPEVSMYLPMSSPVGRFEEDPQNLRTESMNNTLTGPGYLFVPQDHLFWNEDGTAKISENPAVSFIKDKRFSERPEELEKRRWAETQGPLMQMEEHYRALNWSRAGKLGDSVPRFMGHGPLDVHHALPPDAPGQRVKLKGHTQLQAHAQRRTFAPLKKGASAARSALPKSAQERPKRGLDYFSNKVQHTAKPPPAKPASEFHKGVSARVALSQSDAAKKALSKTLPIRSQSAASEQPVVPPRCASELYTKRIDRAPLPVTDGFLGIDRSVNQFTIDFRTSDRKNPFHSTSSRTPETNLLHNHQASILTNGVERGPGTYLGPAQFGVGLADEISGTRKAQQSEWREFRTGCKEHNQRRDQEAQKLIQRKANRILTDLHES